MASILDANLLLRQKRITSRTYITLLWYMRDLLPLNVKTNHIIIPAMNGVLQKTKKTLSLGREFTFLYIHSLNVSRNKIGFTFS